MTHQENYPLTDKALLAGIRVTIVSLIPDAGHIIPLLRIAKAIDACGAQVLLVCPDEALLLAEKAQVSAVGFGRVVPQAEVRWLNRLSEQSELMQCVMGNGDVWRNYTWALYESVFQQLSIAATLITESEPDLLITDDHLFRTQYRWLAERCNVPLILHFSAGTRHPYSRPETWTWLSGRTKRVADFTSRVRAFLAVRMDRAFRPSRYSELTRRRAYMRQQWKYFDLEAVKFRQPMLRIATGTAILEDLHCKHALNEAELTQTIALPPLPPLKNEQMEPELAEWLAAGNGQPVLYVCFGTMVRPTPELCDKFIKLALQQGARVLWASPRPPDALLETDGHLAKWVRWAPQARVLEHPQVSAFLSHAGAGALQEAIWFGKPIICVPFQWDQFYNAWVARQLGCGVTVDRKASKRTISRALASALWNDQLRNKSVELSRSLEQMETSSQLIELISKTAASSNCKTA